MNKFAKKLTLYFTTGFIILTGTNSIKLRKEESRKNNNKVISYANYVEEDNFQIAAHRGFSSLEVENTKEAISLANKEAYIDYIEVDLRTTKDNKIVLSHDDILLSTKGNMISISNTNYDILSNTSFRYTLKKINTIQKFDNTEFSLSTLEDCLNLCSNKKLILDLKLGKNKEKFINQLDCELKNCDKKNNILIQSSNLEELKKIESEHPEYNTMAIIKRKSDLNYIDDFDNLCIKKNLITKDLVETIDNKKIVAIWTINTNDELDRIVDVLDDDYQNVIYITDYPDVIASHLHEKEKIKEKTTN